MKDLSIEEKAKRYDEAIAKGRQIQNTPYTAHWDTMKEVVEYLLPELKENEDEKIRKGLIQYFSTFSLDTFAGLVPKKIIAWLEKQGEQKETLCDKCRREQPSHSCQDITELGRCALEHQNKQKPIMIQWQGNNLKEVIDFTGKDKNFEKWFKSFEEYEQYVQKHNGIFKLFNADGSHYDVPVGAWIVKTPDGYNVASKAIFIQNHVWSEEDEKIRNWLVDELQRDGHPQRYYDAVKWLKSIKERMKGEVKL